MLWLLVAFALVGKIDASCHPMDGRTYRILVTGHDRGSFYKWVGATSWGNWLYAKYRREEDAVPLYFQAVPYQCNTYKLQDKWLNDDRWVSYRPLGMLLRAVYKNEAAMPIYFKDVGGGEWKMRNDWPGQGYWLSYGNLRAVKASYSESAAMKVLLYETEESQRKNNMHMTSATICFNMVYSAAGGSSGYFKESVIIQEGSSQTHTYSESLKSSVSTSFASDASETVPLLEQFSANISAEASLESAVASSATFTSNHMSTVTKEMQVDFSKPCYIYQASVTHQMSDGGSFAQQGGLLVQRNTPLNKRCVTQTYDQYMLQLSEDAAVENSTLLNLQADDNNDASIEHQESNAVVVPSFVIVGGCVLGMSVLAIAMQVVRGIKPKGEPLLKTYDQM